jgi:gamma-glutamylcysteine synthetase
MTNLRQVAQQALEALKSAAIFVDSFRGQKATQEAITALQTELAQPEQEPTQWRDMVVVSLVREGINKHKARELADHFATPPAAQRPWVGLTDEEILRTDPWEILRADPWMGPSDSNINPYQILLKVRTLEAKLKERNT